MSFVAHCRLATVPIAILLVVVFLVTPSTVFADDVDEQVRQLADQGREYFQDGEYLRAAETFVELESFLDSPPPQLYHNIGQAFLRAEELVEAEKYLQKYLAEAPDDPEAERVAELIIDIQEQRVARIATVQLQSQPAGAQIYIDGESQCQTPCSVDLDPGEYSFRATLDDHSDATREVVLEPRENSEVTFSLDAMVFSGYLTVRSDVDDAVLIVDGRDHSLPLRAPLELEAGSYSITVRHGADAVTHDVEIERDETLHLFIPTAGLSSDGGLSTTQAAAIGLGGGALALAIAATSTGMQARATHERLQTQHSAFGSVDADLVTSGRSQQRAANFLWIGAASTLVAGAGLWTWDMMNSGSSEPLEPTEIDDETEQPTVDAEHTPDIEPL